MKDLKIISNILIVLGVLLFLVGLMFKVMHWPDMFKGIISGPIFILTGVIMLIIRKVKKNAI